MGTVKNEKDENKKRTSWRFFNPVFLCSLSQAFNDISDN